MATLTVWLAVVFSADGSKVLDTVRVQDDGTYSAADHCRDTANNYNSHRTTDVRYVGIARCLKSEVQP